LFIASRRYTKIPPRKVNPGAGYCSQNIAALIITIRALTITNGINP